MNEVVSINDIIDIIKEKLASDGSVILKITGNSMYHFLVDRLDSVVLRKPHKQLKKGDIVFFQYHNKWILHRIIKVKGNQLVICGDALKRYEYAKCDDVIGVVEKVIRNEREIDIRKPFYRLKVWLWMSLKPFRRYLLWILRKVGRD